MDPIVIQGMKVTTEASLPTTGKKVAMLLWQDHLLRY